MIKETPVIDHLAVQVQNRQSNEWENLHHWITRCSIRRGGGRRAPVNSMQVGTANLDLVGDIDVQYDARLAPNRPVRVVRNDVIPGRHLYSIDTIGHRVTMWTERDDPALTATAEPLANGGYAFGITSDGTGTGDPVVINRLTFEFWATGMQPGRRYKLTATVRDLVTQERTGTAQLVAFTYGKDDGSDGSGFTYGNSRDWSNDPEGTPVPEITFPYPDTDPQGGAWMEIQVTPEQGAVTIDPTLTDAALVFHVYEFDLYELPTEPTPIFTGKIGDTTQQHVLDKTTGDLTTFTTMVAHDAVQDHANTQRYGAVTEGSAGRETWADRINRLARSSTVPVNLRTPSDIIVTYWDKETTDYWYPKPYAPPGPRDQSRYVTVGGDPRAIQWDYVAEIGWNGIVSMSPYVGAPAFSVTPGRIYRVAMSVQVIKPDGVTGADEFRFGVNTQTNLPWLPDGPAYEAENVVNFTDDEPQRLVLDWTATDTRAFVDLHPTILEGTSADNWVMVPEGESVQIRVWDYSVSIVNYDEPYLLQDVEYESSLVNHFDLACNSVGARWWVDTAGVTQFQRLFEGQQFDAVLTDRPAELVEDATAPIHYTDLSTGFDTGAVVNQLRINQHGREITPNGPQAVNETYLAADSNSMLSWGRRAGNIDTCLYLGETHSADLDLLSRRVFQDHARARYQINRIRWNAQENPALAASLDIYARVQGFFRDLTQRARIVGIRHEITPTRWMVDYDLTDIQVGPTFAEFNTAYSGWTFADLNAEFAGATFAEFNADPIHEYTEWTTQATNRVTNPSFESDLTGWATSGLGTGSAVRSNEWAATPGGYSCKVTTSSTNSGDVRLSPMVVLTPGETYTVTARIMLPAAHTSTSTTSRQRRILYFYNKGDGYKEMFGPQAPNTPGEHTLTHTFTVPEGTQNNVLGVGCAGSSTDPTFVTYVDHVSLGTEGTPYFDGDTPSSSLERYVWAGDPNASPSYYQTRERIE